MDTAQVANALAVLVIALSPLVLKHVKLDSHQMVVVAYVVALAVAAGAGLISGSYKPDLSSVPALIASSAGLFGLQQVVFQIFKDNQTVGPYLR